MLHQEMEINSKQEITPPKSSNIDAFKCPITLDYFVEPMLASDGHTYEKSAILEWFNKSDRSPLTGQKLHSKALYINWSIKKAMGQTFSAIHTKDQEIKEMKEYNIQQINKLREKLVKSRNRSCWDFFFSRSDSDDEQETHYQRRCC